MVLMDSKEEEEELVGSSSKVQDLKEKGNAALKDGRYAEAVFHYTHALKIDPTQYQLYSNRSLAFLKMQQYYHAYEDAKETISMKPDWPKGYYRKAEVEYQTEHYDEAIKSYRQALQLNDGDGALVDAIRKSKRELVKLRKADQQIPWVGAGIGFILGVVVVVTDHGFSDIPILKHPLLKLAVVGVFSVICFGLAKLQRCYLEQQRKGHLHPPFDLLGNFAPKQQIIRNEDLISTCEHERPSVATEPADGDGSSGRNIRQRFPGNKM